MVNRFLSLALFFLSSQVSAQQRPELSEAQAIELALARPALKRAVASRIKEARAQLEESIVRPAPTLGITHEQVLGDDRVASLAVSIVAQQQLDPGRWRSRAREGLAPQEAAIKASGEQRRQEIIRAVRMAFYEARYHQLSLEVLEEELATFERGVAAINERFKRDDASRYELLRLERERALVLAQRDVIKIKLAQARGQLSVWMGQPTGGELIGMLRPGVPAGIGSSAARSPRLEQLDYEAQALVKAREVWGEPWLRGWSVGAGYRLASMGPVYGHGFILSLTAPLPLWSVDQPRRARIDAQREVIEQERELLSVQIASNIEATHARCTEALIALDRLDQEEVASKELKALAKSAYEAGEAPLSEWLEVQRRELAIKLTYQELAWQARQASIELDYQRSMEGSR